MLLLQFGLGDRSGQKKFQNYVDHVLALFPFEPPYFINVGLSCDFVGHPIVSEITASKENIIEFKKQYSLGDQPINFMSSRF